MKCPKCNEGELKEFTNKKRQRIGRCPSCGKLAYLGKAEGTESQKEKNAPPESKKTEPAAKPAAAPRTHRTGKRAAAKPRTETKPAREPVQQQPRTFGQRVADFFNREL